MIITLKGADFSGAGNNIGNLSQIGGTFTFTINPTPSDATVKINGTTRKSITGAYGTAISWEVSKDGYNTRTGSLTMPLGGKTMSVSLTAVGSTTPPVTPEEPGTGGGSGDVYTVNLSDYPVHVGICATGNGAWGNTSASALLRKSAFIPVSNYKRMKVTMDNTTYKYNVVFYSSKTSQPSEVNANNYITDFGGWIEYNEHEFAIPSNAQYAAVGVAYKTKTTAVEATTLADIIQNIELNNNTVPNKTLSLSEYSTVDGICASGNGNWSTTETALLRKSAFINVDGYSSVKFDIKSDLYKFNVCQYSNAFSDNSGVDKTYYLTDFGGWEEGQIKTVPVVGKTMAIGVALKSGEDVTAATLAEIFNSIELIG